MPRRPIPQAEQSQWPTRANLPARHHSILIGPGQLDHPTRPHFRSLRSPTVSPFRCIQQSLLAEQFPLRPPAPPCCPGFAWPRPRQTRLVLDLRIRLGRRPVAARGGNTRAGRGGAGVVGGRGGTGGRYRRSEGGSTVRKWMAERRTRGGCGSARRRHFGAM